MLAQLKNHPFAVEAYFKSSLVLTFAVKKDILQSFIPECLTLDTFKDKWAFIAVAMVQTKHLRPKRFPKFMGDDFFLIGYRIFVRYTNKNGKRLRGLYIIKSETDMPKMTFLGNLFTHYNYTTNDVNTKLINNSYQIISEHSKLKIISNLKKEASLPQQSPFENWKEARRFAGPLPFTFTYNEAKKEVLIIEGVRTNWKPRPVEVTEFHIEHLNNIGLKQPKLANAFIIENIPYQWKKGKKELWN